MTMPDPTWTDYVQLRRSSAPAPAPNEDGVRYYADESGALRSLQSNGDDAPVGGSLPYGPFVVSVPVTSAEILDLANTDVVLVPGEAGFVAIVTAVAVSYLAGGTPYTDNDGAIVVAIRPVSNPTAPQAAASFPTVGLWDQATDQLVGQPYGSWPSPFSPPSPASDFSGRDVILYDDTANPSAGDGTLSVTLAYILAPST